MKFYKLLPLVALVFSATATSAFALGKDNADETTGKMCQQLAAGQIKFDAKAVHDAVYGSDAVNTPDVKAGTVHSGIAQ